MRIDILPKRLNYYKANLHSHSTLSDGQPTPEEMKAAYKEKGYSILSITDHNVFIPHNDLTEADFLMLNGIEYNADPHDGTGRTCHFCAIAPDGETELQPLFHRTEYFAHTAKEAVRMVKFDESLPD
jgi:predicted metal-dependent phosphoesterase TrpH